MKPIIVRPAPENDWNAMVKGQIGWHVTPQGDGWIVTPVFGPDALVSDEDAPEKQPTN